MLDRFYRPPESRLGTSFNHILTSEYKLGCLQVCKSLKEAQDVVDAYIAYVNSQNAISIGDKIIKTEYVDYPQEK